jgi:hypothetical protein
MDSGGGDDDFRSKLSDCHDPTGCLSSSATFVFAESHEKCPEADLCELELALTLWGAFFGDCIADGNASK